MKTGDYTLSKRFLSFLGNFQVTDATGATVMRFVGYLRIALRFDAKDAAGRVLFRGQGRLVIEKGRVDFTQNGQPCGLMRTVRVAGTTGEGTENYDYVVDGCEGGALRTLGDRTKSWSLMNEVAEVVRVERRGRRWSVRLLEAEHGAFALTVVMAIVYMTLAEARTLGTDS